MKTPKQGLCPDPNASSWSADSRKRRRAERFAPGCVLPEPRLKEKAPEQVKKEQL